MGSRKNGAAFLQSWFVLTPVEIAFLAGITVILCIGLLARNAHLRGEGAAAEQSDSASTRD